ncbi:MAG: PAS domain S-box protein [Phycisphaerae bacterium]
MNDHNTTRPSVPHARSHASRWRPLLVVFLLAFSAEFAIMMVLPTLGFPIGPWGALVDSAMLAVLLVPGLAVLGLVKHRDDDESADLRNTPGAPGIRRRLWSLRNQFIIILTVLAVGPLVWVGWSVRREVSAELDERARASVHAFLDRISRDLRHHFKTLRRDVLTVVQYPPVTGLLRCRDAGGIDPQDGSTAAEWKQRLETLFGAYAATHDDVAQVRLLDERGHECVRVDRVDGAPTGVPDAHLQDKSDRAYFNTTLALPNGRCYVSSLDLNTDNGADVLSHKPILRVATPVWFQGRPRGAVVISYSALPVLDHAKGSESGHILLADAAGTYIQHPDESKPSSAELRGNANIFRDWPALRPAMHEGSAELRTGDRILFATRVRINPDDPDYTWVLASEHDARTLFGPSRRVAQTVASAVVGVGAIALAVALCMSQCWGRRVVRLAAAANRLCDGDYTARVPPGSSDELGDLARAFNRMAETIGRHTEKLETQVRRRTHDLDTQKRALDEHAIVSITDVQGNITYVNDKFCEISGYTREELLGKNHRLLKSDEHPPEFFRDMWRTISAQRIWHGEIKNVKKDGSVYWVDATIVPFTDPHGTITQYVAIRTDITERREAADKIRAYAAEVERQQAETNANNAVLRDINAHLKELRERAELATKAKSDFLANMSHEIRTPMTAILGFAETLLDADQTESERLACIRTIRRNGEHLLSIINDILDLSKIEAGHMTIERIPCQPCALIADVASLGRARAAEKGLTCNIEYIGAIPETIRTDPTRLRQILVNLIGNAIKFTQDGGVRLIVRFVPGAGMDRTRIGRPQEPLTATENQDPPHTTKHQQHHGHGAMQFDLIDTGVGMSEDQVARLFVPFTQADASTTRRFGGTGLGLTISKRFAQMLGGDITVIESRAGIGTRFRATVATGPIDGVNMLHDPYTATTVRHDTAGQRELTHETPLADYRILLAEDGPDNQRLIGHVLGKAGADVTITDNGRLAVDAALAAERDGNPFDIILMDMQMPVMDGYQAAGKLREQGYDRPIIALTAHAMAGDRDKCINAGCDDYATKPIDRNKLIRVIQAHHTHAPVA